MVEPRLCTSMRVRLSDERKRTNLTLLTEFYAEEFDEEVSAYKAERILEFFVKTLGPPVYNQAIHDARAFMLDKLDDLDAEFSEPEEPVRNAEPLNGCRSARTIP